MSYTPYYENGWQNNESGSTPITAEALNHMDNGIGAANEDTGWQDAVLTGDFALYNSSNPVQYRRIFKMVFIRGVVHPVNTLDSTNTTTIFTLPEGYRPSRQVNMLCQGTGTNAWLLQVFTTGEIKFSRYRNSTEYNTSVATTVWLPFDVTFTVD